MQKINQYINKLVTAEERSIFFDDIWSSSIFRSKKMNNFLKVIKEEFVKHPRYFYNMQNQELERAAFTSWYNILSLKEYQNPYIKDLYYLHELFHIATMPYKKNLSFLEWSLKMRENEVMASLLSEVFIYFEFPELRQHTMPHEIWVDRFLIEEVKEMNSLARQNLIIKSRHEAYLNPKDEIEEELAFFKKFSHLFYQTWEKDYNLVEQTISVFKNNKDDLILENFFQKNISKSGTLFIELVKKHHNNYLNNKFIREKY